MRKAWLSYKYKNFNKKRSKDRQLRSLIFKEKKKLKNKSTLGQIKGSQKKRQKPEPYIPKPAPSNFSFINNTEAVLTYFEEIQSLFNRRKNVLVDLRNVSNLTNDAIVLLLAITNSPSITKYSEVRGNYPKDEKLKTILTESGIFNNVNEKGYKNYILTRRNKKAEGKTADELIKRATKVVFGKEGRCPGIYKALLECMANTCYHAKPRKTAYETWWLTVYHDKEKNHVSFAFIDIGVGIFKSNRMRNFTSQFASLFGFNNNIDILKEILSGRKKSSTQIPYRGKGLPAIFKGLERNYYSNLKIISNDVKADLQANVFTKLDKEFKGTFLYWELNNTNRWTQ